MKQQKVAVLELSQHQWAWETHRMTASATKRNTGEFGYNYYTSTSCALSNDFTSILWAG